MAAGRLLNDLIRELNTGNRLLEQANTLSQQANTHHQNATHLVTRLSHRFDLLEKKRSIGLLPVREPVRPPCDHIYCAACIRDWLNRGNTTCPLDQRKIRADDLKQVDNESGREAPRAIVQRPSLPSLRQETSAAPRAGLLGATQTVPTANRTQTTDRAAPAFPHAKDRCLAVHGPSLTPTTASVNSISTPMQFHQIPADGGPTRTNVTAAPRGGQRGELTEIT